MKLRRCLRCRKSLCTTQMIPLHSGAGGSLLVGPPSRGRGGWICPGCISTAVEHPQVFSRCFRKSISSVEQIPVMAREWLQNRCLADLKRALRHGLVDSNPNSRDVESVFIVRSNEQSSAKSPSRKSKDKAVETFILDISSIVSFKSLDISKTLLNSGFNSKIFLRRIFENDL